MDEGEGSAHPYLIPALDLALSGLTPPARIFELGCGNGAVAHRLASKGFEVVGVDTSVTGIEIAQGRGGAQIEVGSAYDNLSARYGRFDAVVSLEVVEHLYAPRLFAATVRDLLAPNGRAVISTPYHGYWKVLAIAALGRYDAHHDPLWDVGHIKFFSAATLTKLFAEVGLHPIQIDRVGRVSTFAKSMVATFVRSPT